MLQIAKGPNNLKGGFFVLFCFVLFLIKDLFVKTGIESRRSRFNQTLIPSGKEA